MVRELRDAHKSAGELEVELANAQQRCARPAKIVNKSHYGGRIEVVEKELAESEAALTEVPGLQETYIRQVFGFSGPTNRIYTAFVN